MTKTFTACSVVAVLLGACASAPSSTSIADADAFGKDYRTEIIAPSTPDGPVVSYVSMVGEGDQVICKYETETGSRLKTKRVCATRSEWKEASRTYERSLTNMQGGLQGRDH